MKITLTESRLAEMIESIVNEVVESKMNEIKKDGVNPQRTYEKRYPSEKDKLSEEEGLGKELWGIKSSPKKLGMKRELALEMKLGHIQEQLNEIMSSLNETGKDCFNDRFGDKYCFNDEGNVYRVTNKQ